MKFNTKLSVKENTAIYNNEESRTVQKHKDECNINRIIKRSIPMPQNDRQAIYGDFSEIPDLLTAFGKVKTAQEAFRSLPSEVRDGFGNNPLNLIREASLAEFRGKFEKLGLIEKQVVPDVLDVKGTTDTNNQTNTSPNNQD